MSKGLFIAIEGNDGSGKATQAKLLAEALPHSLKVNFPAYDTNLMGAFVGECLAGKHGDFLHLDPKIASTLYALDRCESSPAILEALEAGKTVIADRFSSSNAIHQGGKVSDLEERAALIGWLEKMEHGILQVPKPDYVIYLRVPVATSLTLLSQERAVKNQHAEGKDTVELDEEYLRRSFDTANWLSERDGTWRVVDCVSDGAMRTREDIHAEVRSVFDSLSHGV